MTPNKAIETIDKLRPNAYDEETKFGWINELDGMTQELIYQDEDIKPYTYPDDVDKELAIPYPFDNVYVLYLEAMIDRTNREYAHYNNSASLFETRYAEFKKDYIRKHKAKR